LKAWGRRALSAWKWCLLDTCSCTKSVIYRDRCHCSSSRARHVVQHASLCHGLSLSGVGVCHICSDVAEMACFAVLEIIDYQEVSLLDYFEGLQTR
jgi:hypothetical protein